MLSRKRSADAAHITDNEKRRQGDVGRRRTKRKRDKDSAEKTDQEETRQERQTREEEIEPKQNVSFRLEVEIFPDGYHDYENKRWTRNRFYCAYSRVVVRRAMMRCALLSR